MFNKLRELIPGIKEDVSLKEYTTFHIGGKAKYFLLVKEQNKLIKAIKMAKKFSLPFFILGGGSNILISDKGYKGLVIKMQNSSFEIRNTRNKEEVIIESEAGVPLGKIVSLARKNNLTGLEWATGIPGTIGGAIRGNAGAFGKSISDIISDVKVLDSDKLSFKDYKKKDCEFTYRGSLFKKNRNLIIISAIIKLGKGNREEIESKMKKYLSYRIKHQPLSFYSAGSVFKNYQGVIKDKNLLKQFPRLLEFNNKKVIPAGFLIDKCGLKGKTIGGAQISEKQANFIVNLGKAKASDVISLIGLIQDKVRNTFGINLEKEIEILK